MIKEFFEELIFGDLDDCFKTLIRLNLESGSVDNDFLLKRVSAVQENPVRRFAVKKVGNRAGKIKIFDPMEA